MGSQQDISQMNILNQLGGFTMLSLVVERLYTKLMDDDLLKDYFSGHSIEEIRQKQVKFLAFAFGGPEATYVGRNLTTVHQRLVVHQGAGLKHFDRLIQVFVQTMDELGIAHDTINMAASKIYALRPLFDPASYPRTRRTSADAAARKAAAALRAASASEGGVMHDRPGAGGARGSTSAGGAERGAADGPGGEQAAASEDAPSCPFAAAMAAANASSAGSREGSSSGSAPSGASESGAGGSASGSNRQRKKISLMQLASMLAPDGASSKGSANPVAAAKKMLLQELSSIAASSPSPSSAPAAIAAAAAAAPPASPPPSHFPLKPASCSHLAAVGADAHEGPPPSGSSTGSADAAACISRLGLHHGPAQEQAAAPARLAVASPPPGQAAPAPAAAAAPSPLQRSALSLDLQRPTQHQHQQQHHHNHQPSPGAYAAAAPDSASSSSSGESYIPMSDDDDDFRSDSNRGSGGSNASGASGGGRPRRLSTRLTQALAGGWARQGSPSSLPNSANRITSQTLPPLAEINEDAIASRRASTTQPCVLGAGSLDARVLSADV